MKYKTSILTLIAALLLGWLTLFNFSLVEAQETQIIAFSLRKAEQIVKELTTLRNKNLKRTGEICELIGFIIDNKMKDIIILGKKCERLSPISLDDLVVLLRCAQTGGLSGPGVSLEPAGGDICSKQLDVVFFGGAANTALGKACFRADYLMKQIALNKVPIGVKRIHTYAALTEKRFREEGGGTWNLLSRFWFTPIYAPVIESEAGDIFLLRETKVGALVETYSAEIDGRIVDTSDFRDQPAETYAAEFTQHYDQVTERHTTFADLARYMGGLKLMTLLLTRVQPEVLDFWLNTYQPTQVKTPTDVKLLQKTSIDGRRQLTLVGGVRIAGLTLRLRKGEVAAIRDAVFLARPSEKTLTWKVTFDRDWRVLVPSASSKDQEIAKLFSSGLIHHEKGDFASAIRSFDQVLKVYPDVLEANFLKAVCARDLAIKQGKVEDALGPLALLSQFVKETPQFLEARYELGVTLRVLGRTEEAIEELEKVIHIRSDFSPGHHALGFAYLTKGDRASATSHLREYLWLENGKDNKWVRNVKLILGRLDNEKQAQTTQKRTEFEKFCDEKLCIRFKYPKGWKVLRADDIGQFLPGMAEIKNVVVAFADPIRPNRNVNIQITPIEADILSDQDIADAIPALDAAYKARFKGFQKVEAGPIDIGNIKGLRYVLKCERAGIVIEQCIVTLVKARKAYTITFTSEELDFFSLWDTYYRHMLSSFQIGKN